jgi:hypothetical protein
MRVAVPLAVTTLVATPISADRTTLNAANTGRPPPSLPSMEKALSAHGGVPTPSCADRVKVAF